MRIQKQVTIALITMAIFGSCATRSNNDTISDIFISAKATSVDTLYTYDPERLENIATQIFNFNSTVDDDNQYALDTVINDTIYKFALSNGIRVPISKSIRIPFTKEMNPFK